MSFSPDINDFGIRIANLFAERNYSMISAPPIPQYNAFINHLQSTGEITSRIPDFSKEPMFFPTIEILGPDGLAHGGSAEAYHHLTAGSDLYDYLSLYCGVAMTKAPTISEITSGFFDWDQGFGYSVNSSVSRYKHGEPGEADNCEGRLDIIQPGIEQLMAVSAHNGEEVSEFMETKSNTVPYQTFFVWWKLLGAPSDVLEHDLYSEEEFSGTGDYTLDRFIDSDGFQQVLYKTEFMTLKPDSSIVFAPGATTGTWAKHPAATDVGKSMHTYPRVGQPQVKTDGFTGDLKVYEAQVYHNYDTSYGYIRDDLKEVFKSAIVINEERDDWVSSAVAGFVSVLSATMEVPRGFRTRRQQSPNSLRRTYTTFGYDTSIEVTDGTTDSSTIGPSAPSTTSTMGGGSY